MKRAAKTRKAESTNQTARPKQATQANPTPLTTIKTGYMPIIENNNSFNDVLALAEELHNLDELATDRSDSEYDAILQYVNTPKRMAFFVVPDTENNKIIACSKDLLDYFDLKGHIIIGQPIWTVINRLIDKFIPLEDRPPIITQQQMLGKMAKGGLYPLPDVKLNAIKNEQPIRLHIIGKHIFSKDGEFLGTLLEYQIHEISEYKPLVSPTPQEILTMLEERAATLKDFLVKFEETAKVALLQTPSTDTPPQMPHHEKESFALREFKRRLAPARTEQAAHKAYGEFLKATVKKMDALPPLNEVLKATIEHEDIVQEKIKTVLESQGDKAKEGTKVGVKKGIRKVDGRIAYEYDQLRIIDAKTNKQRTIQVSPVRTKHSQSK